MKSLIWFWLYSRVSAACDINHALWYPDYGDTVIEDLIQALPGVGAKQFKMLNPDVNPNRIMSGEEYTVPYGPEMTIIPPAIWSGNCPQTLLLHGEETTQDASTPSRQPTPSIPTGSNLPTSDPTSGTMHGRTATSTAASTGTSTDLEATASSTTASVEKDSPTTGSYRATDSTDNEPTNQATDATSKNVDPTTTSTMVSQETVNSIPTSVTKEFPSTGSYKATDSTDSKPTGQPTDVTSHSVDPTITSTIMRKETGSLTTASAETGSPTTGSYRATDATNSKPTSPATDVTSQNVDPTTTASTEKDSPTAGLCHCWEDSKPTTDDPASPKQTRMAATKSFCNQFKKVPLAAENPTKISEQDELVVGAHIFPGCTKSKLDEVKCLEYLKEIESQCPRFGGFLERGCFYLWILKPGTT
jgi:hypothetical protein